MIRSWWVGWLCNNLAEPAQIGFPRHFKGVKQSVRTGPRALRVSREAGGAGQPAADGVGGWGGVCWKFNLECHSFEGGPAACHRHHANLRLSTPQSRDLPCGRVRAAASDGLLSSFTAAEIKLAYFQMCCGFHCLFSWPGEILFFFFLQHGC